MKTKLVGLLAGVISLAAAGAASAADMAVKARPLPPPVPVVTWTSCYVGVNGGWARSEVDAAWVANPAVFGAVAAAAFNSVSLATHTADGGTVGGQFGCNWQQNQWVIGFEVDGNWADLKSHRDAIFTAVANPGAGLATLTQDYQVRAFGTVRARLGLVAGANWLLYVTGGGAWANFRYFDCETAGASLTTCSTVPVAGASGFNAANVTDTRFGWVAGAGFETKFASNWSFKAEYLYMGFGSHSVNAPFTNFPGFAFDPATTNIVFHHRDQNIQTARIGVNYHFGGPVVAKY